MSLLRILHSLASSSFPLWGNRSYEGYYKDEIQIKALIVLTPPLGNPIQFLTSSD